MHYCSSFAEKQYYLCLFFTVCTGAESFESIYIIKGTLHSIFQAVCVTLDLFEDDEEWINCFEEAGHVASDRAQYVLFMCVILQKSVLNNFIL